MRPLALDSGLLVLLILGLASKDLIGRHKRVREYSVADFDLLARILGGYRPIVVTPNVWTETSNLVRQTAEPLRSNVGHILRKLISDADEAYVTSKSASEREEFLRLGLTDAGLLELKPSTIPLLTVDLDLYLAALKLGRAAINFNHLREATEQ